MIYFIATISVLGAIMAWGLLKTHIDNRRKLLRWKESFRQEADNGE